LENGSINLAKGLDLLTSLTAGLRKDLFKKMGYGEFQAGETRLKLPSSLQEDNFARIQGYKGKEKRCNMSTSVKAG
jgi:hypothetical protein